MLYSFFYIFFLLIHLRHIYILYQQH